MSEATRATLKSASLLIFFADSKLILPVASCGLVLAKKYPSPRFSRLPKASLTLPTALSFYCPG